MEAGPRDNDETAVDEVERLGGSVGRIEDFADLDDPAGRVPNGNGAAVAGSSPDTDDADPTDLDEPSADDVSAADFSDDEDPAEAPEDGDPSAASDDDSSVEPHELRPPRKLRVWQLAPIVGLGTLGSLMFAFPLAFEPGGGTGAVVSMLGLLICSCAAGWGVMAARRVGLTWPGLPARGSGERPDWRVVLLYAVIVGTVALLAIWRVARLR